jgi:hypothetical protein
VPFRSKICSISGFAVEKLYFMKSAIWCKFEIIQNKSMLNQIQFPLFLSFFINILFFIGLALLIAKKGGFSYFFNKILKIFQG